MRLKYKDFRFESDEIVAYEPSYLMGLSFSDQLKVVVHIEFKSFKKNFFFKNEASRTAFLRLLDVIFSLKTGDDCTIRDLGYEIGETK